MNGSEQKITQSTKDVFFDQWTTVVLQGQSQQPTTKYQISNQHINALPKSKCIGFWKLFSSSSFTAIWSATTNAATPSNEDKTQSAGNFVFLLVIS